MPSRYTVTTTHNRESQHRRGLLCDYAVMALTHGRVRAGVRVCAWACVHACVCVCRVTAQPCNSLGVARVSRLRARATA